MKFPFYRQLDTMGFGPTSLRMEARFYGKSYSSQHLHLLSHITREEVPMPSISDAMVDEVIGKLVIPSACLGKITVGQTVNVKLNDLYMEFGMLKGELMSISAVPDALVGGYARMYAFQVDWSRPTKSSSN